MPEGFGAGGAGEAKEVEGFAGNNTNAPPPEGFGDSSSNQGLGDGEKGYLDQAYEDDGSDDGVYEEVDVGPWSVGEGDDDASPYQDHDVGPGGEEEEGAGDEDLSKYDMEPGGYGADDTSETTPSAGRGGPGGQRAFTAQLKAAGYGGFHEWRLLFIKQMLESQNRAGLNR